jgi:hypothetical protein
MKLEVISLLPRYGQLNSLVVGQLGVRPTNPTPITSEPVPPLNYPIMVHLNTNPAGRRGWLYTDTGAQITQSTLRAKAKDFLSGRIKRRNPCRPTCRPTTR